MEGSGMFTGSSNRTTPLTSASESKNSYHPITMYGLQQQQQQPIPHEQPSFMTVHYGLSQISKPNVSPSLQHHQPALNSPIDAIKLRIKSEAPIIPLKMSLGPVDIASGGTSSVFPERPHDYLNYYTGALDDGRVSKQLLQKSLSDAASNRVTTHEMEPSFITSPIQPLTSSVSRTASFSQHLSKMASIQSLSPSQSTPTSISTTATYFDKDDNTHNTSATMDATLQNMATIAGGNLPAAKTHKRKSANVMHMPPSSTGSSCLNGQSLSTSVSSSHTPDTYQLKMPPMTTSSSSQPSNVCKPLDTCSMSMTTCPHCQKDITSVVVSTLMVAGVEKLQPSKTKCENCLRQITFSPGIPKPLRTPKFLTGQDQTESGHILPCPHCPKLYKRSDKLTIHIRSHTGERPFPCTYCGRGFARKDKLKLHIRIHTGEKPYTCSLCEKSFYRGDKLKNHRMKAHLDMFYRRTASDESIADLTSTLSPSEREAAAAAVAATVAEISKTTFSSMTQEMDAKFTHVESVPTTVAEIMPRFSISSGLSSRFIPSESGAAVSLNVPHIP